MLAGVTIVDPETTWIDTDVTIGARVRIQTNCYITAMQAQLVNTAGQQARSILPLQAFLYAERASEFPRPYVKYSVEPARAEDVPAAIAPWIEWVFSLSMMQLILISLVVIMVMLTPRSARARNMRSATPV